MGHMTNVIQQKLSDTSYGIHTRTPRYPAVGPRGQKIIAWHMTVRSVSGIMKQHDIVLERERYHKMPLKHRSSAV